MRVVVVGQGRLGRSLALLWRSAGVEVVLLGRDGTVPAADAVVLAVPDRALASCRSRLSPGVVALHTSGASDLEVLRPHRPSGSLHPLMTFPGPEFGLPDLRGVGAAIAGDDAARSVARELAHRLSMVPFEVPGERALYHASAVMAGNFATALLAEAGDVLSRACHLSPRDARRLLLPLALESLRNAVEDPQAALTGPVARGDEAVITSHRAALSSSGLPDVLASYDAGIAAARRVRATPP